MLGWNRKFCQEELMAIESRHPLITFAAYLALPEGNYDLIEGELIVTPAPSLLHQQLQAHLLSALHGWNRQQGLGMVCGAPTDVVLEETDPAVVVQPDVLFVAKTGAARLTKRGVVGPPDLVVEIVSPGTTRLDGVKKRALYERHGVREFWLVLPDLDQIEALRLDATGRFFAPTLIDATGILESPLLPGFSLPLSELFDVGAVLEYDES
jgi:Uma2 family endonuclease